MSKLREKLNNLDTQNLQNNDTLYSILEEMADRIEKLEGEAPKVRQYDTNYYKATTYFSQTGHATFTYDELSRFIERIIEDKP
jgi:hypothetical protein